MEPFGIQFLVHLDAKLGWIKHQCLSETASRTNNVRSCYGFENPGIAVGLLVIRLQAHDGPRVYAQHQWSGFAKPGPDIAAGIQSQSHAHLSSEMEVFINRASLYG